MPLRSRLLETLAFIYYWQPDEIRQLENELLDWRKAAWRQAVEDSARLHGCPNARANDPRLEDLAELRDLSRQNADSIAATWRRDVDRQLVALYTANPRGNRQYYIANMERWSQRRSMWKNMQIALMTESTTRSYAQNRFRQMNGLRGGRYVYAGPAPVSDECIRRTGAGIVNEAYVQTHPVPAHVNCPHSWRLINPMALNCDEIWVG